MDVTFSPALRVYAEMWEIAGRRRAADAQFSQALTHIRSGTPDAMAKAFDLFKRSGAHNFTEAQFAAGWCCEHGCGTKRNYPQAIRWYKRAENNVTSDVMSAFDPVGEAENARLRLYFECESYAAAVDALLDAQEREDSFMADYAGKFLGAYYDKKIYENDPFAKLDQVGVGKLVKMAAKLGRETRPELHLGICGEHGGDPSSVEFCHKVGLDYVSCSPFRVPIARLAAAQAAIKDQQ